MEFHVPLLDAHRRQGAQRAEVLGDARRGQSLVVWAIWEGREAARGVDAFLMGATELPASPLAV